jgi:cell division protein ZapA
MRALDVNIMGREYRIACPFGQEAALREAVLLVEQKMKETASRSRSNMPERVAVLAAVNLASDYLEAARQTVTPSGSSASEKTFISERDTAGIWRRIKTMDARLGDVLADKARDA